MPLFRVKRNIRATSSRQLCNVLPKVRNGAKGVFLSRSILFNNSATYLRQESTLCARTRNKSAVSCKNPYRDSMPGLSTKYIRSRSFCASVNRSRRVSKDASCRRAHGQVVFHQLPYTALKNADSPAGSHEICPQLCVHWETTLEPAADRQNSCRCRPL